MAPTIAVFERSPDCGRGLARDMAVRWALEEVGRPYDVRLLSSQAMKQPAHLALHPFGQIPTYEDGDLGLFESGAIVLHIAERHAGLPPDGAHARARTIAWMSCTKRTMEPPIVDREVAARKERGKPCRDERPTALEGPVRERLDQVFRRPGHADWLDNTFSAGDLMMVTVLRRLIGSGLLEDYLNLCSCVARGEARPAFKRAFADQLAVFTGYQSQER